jgi:hypothetical protein
MADAALGYEDYEEPSDQGLEVGGRDRCQMCQKRLWCSPTVLIDLMYEATVCPRRQAHLSQLPHPRGSVVLCTVSSDSVPASGGILVEPMCRQDGPCFSVMALRAPIAFGSCSQRAR